MASQFESIADVSFFSPSARSHGTLFEQRSSIYNGNTKQLPFDSLRTLFHPHTTSALRHCSFDPPSYSLATAPGMPSTAGSWPRERRDEDTDSPWDWTVAPPPRREEMQPMALVVWQPQHAAEQSTPRPWHAHRENEWPLLDLARGATTTPEGPVGRRTLLTTESRIPPAIRRQRAGIWRGVLPPPRSVIVHNDMLADGLRVIDRPVPKALRRPFRSPPSRLSDASLARLFTASLSLRTPPRPPTR